MLDGVTLISFVYLQLFSDGWFLTAMDIYLRLRLKNKEAAPTYAYLLTHRGSASHTDIFHGDPETFYGKYVECSFMHSAQN